MVAKAALCDKLVLDSSAPAPLSRAEATSELGMVRCDHTYVGRHSGERKLKPKVMLHLPLLRGLGASGAPALPGGKLTWLV